MSILMNARHNSKRWLSVRVRHLILLIALLRQEVAKIIYFFGLAGGKESKRLLRQATLQTMQQIRLERIVGQQALQEQTVGWRAHLDR
jgi:hypothetical protein